MARSRSGHFYTVLSAGIRCLVLLGVYLSGFLHGQLHPAGGQYPLAESALAVAAEADLSTGATEGPPAAPARSEANAVAAVPEGPVVDEPKPAARAESEAEGEATGEAESEAKSKARSDAENEARGEAKGEAKSDAKNRAKSEAKGVAKSEAKNRASKSDAKNKAKSDAEDEAKNDAENKAKSDAENEAGREPVPKTVCMAGLFVPTLYVLGQVEAGAARLSGMLVRGGVRYARNITRDGQSLLKDKETKSLRVSWLCRYQPENQSASPSPGTPGCNFTQERRERWRRTFTERCPAGVPSPRVYADTSQYNLGLPGLPPVLAEVYGARARRLEFIVCLREPLQRLAAEFARLRRASGTTTSFEDYVGPLVRELPAYGDAGRAEIARSYRHMLVYRSLYALNLEPWFDQFNASKFVLVPARLLGNVTSFRLALKQIVAALNWSAFKVPRIRWQDVPPLDQTESKGAQLLSLAQNLTNGTRDRLSEYFLADTRKLSEMLLQRTRQGLCLVGAERSELNTAGDVLAFLSASW